MGFISAVSPQISLTVSRLQNTNPVSNAPASEDNSNPIGQQAQDTAVSTQDFQLTEEEQEIVRELRARDREVRAHERAHATAGGQYASQPTFDTVTGPDGQQYAVGGSVQIDVAPVPNDPEATIRKMNTVIRAALAPAQPSPQDRQVAAQARSQLIQAQSELRRQNQEELLSQQEENEEGQAPSPLEEAIAAYDVVSSLNESETSTVNSLI